MYFPRKESNNNNNNIKKIRTMWESKSHDDFIHQLNLALAYYKEANDLA